MLSANITSPHEPPANPAGRPVALVIDDDPLFRSLLTSMLKREYHVITAADGKDGFYKALEFSPVVAVVDIQMPVWDGLRTLKSFREHPHLKSTAVVMLTSDASRETVLAAVQGGADDYVIKTTLTREEFLLKLTRVREKRLGRPASQATSAATVQQMTTAPSSRQETSPATTHETTEERLQTVLDSWE